MNTTKLKMALIGCGRIGQRHAEHINNNAELVAVCDIDPGKVENIGKQYNAAVYNNIEELLVKEKNIDLVSICTPNGLHAEHTISSLRAGHHVLCEKPMCINVPDCGRMIQEAEKANKRLFVIKQNRFNPPVAELKRLIDKNQLGKIFSVQLNCFWNRNPQYYNTSDWKGTKKLDGGTLYTQFSHFVDLLYYLVGDIKEVAAFTDNFNHVEEIEFEDTGVVALRFYNGALGTIHYTVNSYAKNMEGSITIFAEKGTVKIGGQYLNELEYQSFENFKIENLPKGNPPNQYGQYVGSMSNHDKVYENVVEVLKNGGVIATNSFEGLKTVEIIDKIYTSANK
jgi:UDP-N-acetyl-2-amino-2-deoxyglucuronate dehydrogenase